MFGLNKKVTEEKSKKIMEEIKTAEPSNELYRVGYDSLYNMVTFTLMNEHMSMTLRMDRTEVNRLKRMLDSVFDDYCDHEHNISQ